MLDGRAEDSESSIGVIAICNGFVLLVVYSFIYLWMEYNIKGEKRIGEKD